MAAIGFSFRRATVWCSSWVSYISRASFDHASTILSVHFRNWRPSGLNDRPRHTSRSHTQPEGPLMSMVSDVLDRIPPSDGGLRRKFNGGILFVLIFTIGVFWFPGISVLATFISGKFSAINPDWTILNSFTFAIVLVSIVFVIGNLIDVVSEMLLSRILSIFGGVYVRHRMSEFTKVSDRSGSGCQPPSSSQVLRTIHSKLPFYVRKGLENPYGRQFVVAFRYLISIAPVDEKAWLQQLDTRNRNLFSVLSSMFIAVSVVVTMTLAMVEEQITHERSAPYNLDSSEARRCYSDLLFEIALVEDSLDLTEELEGIQQKDGDVVHRIGNFLERIAPNPASERISQIEFERMSEAYRRCFDIPLPTRIGIDISGSDAAIATVIFISFLIVLYIIHAEMTIGSIFGALEMFSLRGTMNGAIPSEGRTLESVDPRELRAKLERMAAARGYKLGDIFPEINAAPVRRKRRRMPTKYHNPQNPEQTWSGIGQTPKWVQAILTRQGIHISEFKSNPEYRIVKVHTSNDDYRFGDEGLNDGKGK